MPAFRDPPDPRALAHDRRVAIARALVGATELPVALPKLGMTLVDAQPAGDAFDLVLGIPSEVARVRIHAPKHRPEAGGGGEITVEARETQPAAARFRAQLRAIRERLAIAITPEKIRQARAEADALRAIPVDVPLDHFRKLVEGMTTPSGLVRTGFRCNQDCGFCWQSREWPGYDAAQLRTWIEDLHAMGAVDLTISGGEPTLDRHLPEHVRLASSLGMSPVVIETNAIQIGKRPALARELREAGLTRAFVALHSADAATSDHATRAPGTHARTVAGVIALLEAGVTVILNAVITTETVGRLHELPPFVAENFVGRGPLAGISISLAGPSYERALTQRLAADPEEVRAALARTIEAAEAHRVLLFGLDGPCGPPLCMFGADRRVTELEPKPPVSFRRHVKECEGCRVRDACYGVSPDTYDAFGARAVTAIA